MGRCGCAGYTTDQTAFGEPVPVVDIVTPTLRSTPGDAVPAPQPLLAPARDMFDEGRRLRGLDELDRVPWRPPN